MTGILKKIEQGWIVIYDQILGEDIVKKNQNALPLHPEDIKVQRMMGWDGKEVEFEIISNAIVKDGVIVGSEVYAKLVYAKLKS